MGTLVKKGLVIKESSPARYSLTDAGCELAHRLEAVQPDTQDDSVPFRLHQGATLHSPPRPQTPVPDPLHLPTLDQPLSPEVEQGDGDVQLDGVGTDQCPFFTNSETSGLKYCYVTEDGVYVKNKDKAAVTFNDELSVGFLVKCNYAELLQSGLRYKLDTARPISDAGVYVYLHNDDTANLSPLPAEDKTGCESKKGSSEPTHRKTSGTGRKEAGTRCENTVTENTNSNQSAVPRVQTELRNGVAPIVIDSEESSVDSVSSLQVERKVQSKYTFKSTKTKPTNVSSVKTDSHTTSHATSVIKPFSDTLNVCTSTSLSAQGSMCTSVTALPRRQISQDSQELSQDSVKSLTSVSSVQSLPPPEFSLLPGQFEIILCVDNQEFYGKSKSGGKNLLPELIKNGVTCDLRKLQVGDLLWIAREKQSPQLEQLGRGEGRELALDYIIERKRMDDLVSSCIDGRFKEQKFRLKQCGLRNPMYLIEEYGSMQHFSIPETTIKQTIVNTQVIDGFQVKRTKGTKDTVAFLTVMTRYLQGCFGGKTLHATRLEDLKETPFSIGDAEHRLATFEEFNRGSVKTKALSTRETFARQLMQVHGMSKDKARAVIDVYPTLLHLIEAYGRCISEKAKETLLSSIKCGKSGRSLGSAPSKLVYQLYCTNTSLT